MGDISIKCSSCGKEVTVSEFVDPESLECVQCGAAMVVPDATPRHDDTPTVLMRRKPPVEEDDDAEEGTERTKRRRRATKSRRTAGAPKRRSVFMRFAKFEISEYWLAWATFLILTPILMQLRWGGIFKADALEDCKTYGMIGMTIVHIIVLLEAFKEEMFDGLLGLFIPPYVIYYVFFKSDSFALRAIMGAFLMSFGFDMFIFSSEYMKIFMDEAHDWMKGDGYE